MVPAGQGLKTNEALVFHAEFGLVMNRYLAPVEGAAQEVFQFHTFMHDRA